MLSGLHFAKHGFYFGIRADDSILQTSPRILRRRFAASKLRA
jgi:hypothetical protein